MPRYNVQFSWDKHIDFPPIISKDKEEAIQIANLMLSEDNNLTEEDGLTEWEAEEIND